MNLEKKNNSTRNYVDELKKTLLARREQRAKVVPQKKEKKEDLIFGGKPFISTGDFKKRIENDPDYRIFKKTQIKREERKNLAPKILLKKFGRNIDPYEIKRMPAELSQGKFGGYKDLTQVEKKKIKKIIDAINEKKN